MIRATISIVMAVALIIWAVLVTEPPPLWVWKMWIVVSALDFVLHALGFMAEEVRKRELH